jgi:hypothetical protein
LKRHLFTLALGLLGLGLSGLPAPAQEPAPPLTATDPSARPAQLSGPAQLSEMDAVPIAASSFAPPVEISTAPIPVEFFFFFRHLAGLEIAANGAIASGNANAIEWKSQDARAAGLTTAEGAIVLEVAAGCNEVLGDYAAEIQAQAAIPAGEPPVPGEPSTGRTEIVNAAIEELRLRLDEASFQALVDYVHATFGPEIDGVILVPLPPSLAAPGPGGPVVEPDAGGPEISVISHISKLSGFQVQALCDTAIMDDLTARSYPGTDTVCTLYGPGPWVDVPCGQSFPGQCSVILPTFPGSSHRTQGGHNLGLTLGQCGTVPNQLLDPLHYCGAQGSQAPVFNISGSLHPLGDYVCWNQNSSGDRACGLAQTVGRVVTFVEAYPSVVTLFPNGEQRFTSNIPAYLSLSGPGTLTGTLYRAPATITTPQTAQIRACDANPAYPDDCVTATINLRPPFTVEVEPANREVLPGAELTYTAKIVPPSSTTAAEWSVSTAGTEPVGNFPSHSGLTGVYKAPANADIDRDQENTVKACVKPDDWGPTVCGTTQVTVPSLLIYIDPEKTTLESNETIRVTAYVFGTDEPQTVIWTSSNGFITTTSQDDTLHATYTAGSASPQGADITVCLQASPTACNTPQRPLHLNIVDPLAITSVAAQYNAGQVAPFTILGHGFGSNPQVSFSNGSVALTLRTDTRIEGQLILPVSAGGKTTRATVRVNYFNGDFREVYSTPPQPITPATLRIDPLSAEVEAGGTKQFQALCLIPSGVLCTAPEAPSWPQPSLGTVTQTGLYTAPATVPAITSIFVSACWAGAPCPSAVVTLVPADSGVAVSLIPETATVEAGQAKQFTATVVGHDDKRVTWSRTPNLPAAGSINANGLYTAPVTLNGVASVTITATSVADPTKSDSSTVTLTPPPPLNLSCSRSPASANYGNPITFTATATGGVPSTYEFAFFRRRAGQSTWTPPVNSPNWQTSNTHNWTPLSADVGSWESYVWVRDANNQPFVACSPGGVEVKAPNVLLTLTSTMSPSSSPYGRTITWTATATGGAGNFQYAFFRRPSGVSAWTPPVTAPNWQTSRNHSWTPAANETGNWDTYVWARDADTPPTMNIYGYEADFNPGGVLITTPAPLTLTSTMSPSTSPYGTTITWTATSTGGIQETVQYAFFRRPSGTNPWTPPAGSPNWQASNVHHWTPSSSETGSWDTYVWVRDINTPPSMFTYGYAAGFNPGGVRVTTPSAPLTLTSTMSPSSSPYGRTITWTATATGGVPGTIQYAFFRRPSGDLAWIPPATAPSWQSSRFHSWTPTSADAKGWDTYVWVRDANTSPTQNAHGYTASFNTGGVLVTTPAPLDVTSTMSPSSSPAGASINWTATSTGGIQETVEYAFFRRRSGELVWVPPATSPIWQSSPTHSWTPGSSDAGAWDTYVWVRDINTTPTQSTHGYADGFNTGGMTITIPVQQDYPAKGWVDGYNTQHIWGWACDPDYPTQSNRVDVWGTNGQSYGGAGANMSSNSGIGAQCLGGTAHYFDYQLNGAIPSGAHFNVWSIDLPYATPGNDNRKMGGTGAIGGTEFVMP